MVAQAFDATRPEGLSAPIPAGASPNARPHLTWWPHSRPGIRPADQGRSNRVSTTIMKGEEIMIRKLLIAIVAAAFVAGGLVSASFAADKGPAEITLHTEGKKGTFANAFFPHAAHQAKFKCGTCHHGMKDGKQVPYTEGQKIQACTDCHNKKVMAGKKAGKEHLDTLKGAAHARCRTCHDEEAAKNPDLKKIKSCKNCHRKK